MQKLPILGAALAVALLTVPALAFDIDTSTSSNPDGTARYADPDDKPLGGALGSVTVGPSANFNGNSATSSPSQIPQSWQDLGWANPLPDKRAK